MGGGRRHFLPTVTSDPEHRNREGRRLDGRNLAEDWAREKKRRRLRAQYIHSREQLAKLDPRTVDYLLGKPILFAETVFTLAAVRFHFVNCGICLRKTFEYLKVTK